VHVLVHVAMLAVLSHIFLQSVYFFRPALPFSRASRRGQRAMALLGGMLPAILGMSLIVPLLAYWVYPSRWLPAVVLPALLLFTFLLERRIPARVRTATADLECAD
jgi:hypothetical protein